MSEALPVVYLAGHGETAWSLSGKRVRELNVVKVKSAALERARGRKT